MRRAHRLAAVTTAAVTLLAGGVVLAPAASAVDYAPYQAKANRTVAPIGTPIVVTGRTAASWTEPGKPYPGPGTKLCLFRQVDAGRYRMLDICTTVNKDRTFRLRAYLGRVGTFTYVVGDDYDAKVGDIVLVDDLAMSSPPMRLRTTW